MVLYRIESAGPRLVIKIYRFPITNPIQKKNQKTDHS